MRCAFAIVCLLAASAAPPALGAGTGEPESRAEERRAAQAELGALAIRIEAMKREVAAGRSDGAELEPLLARAQELASLLERGDGGALARRSVGPDPRDLRERADALRDRADRLASAIADVDRRLRAARRRAELEDRLEAVGGPDLFSDAAPRRGSSPAAAATTSAPPPPGPASIPGTATPGGGGPAAAPVPSAPAPAPNVTRADVAPPGGSGDARAPAAGDALPTLHHKRAEMAAALSALRAQAEALEAEATAAEAVR